MDMYKKYEDMSMNIQLGGCWLARHTHALVAQAR